VPFVQPSFDDAGTPLAEVTFVVLDLETTGGSAAADEITEVGALKLRGGELLGTFETLVNPGVPIPPVITVLTGITEAMVLPAPRIDEVLPALLEFVGDAVVVGHNVRFDAAFLDAALVHRDYPRLANRRVDTLGIARRLVRDEVPDLRLATLARHFRTAVEPSHRAFADASATAEVFHALLERAAGLGVLGLDDLLSLPGIRAHPCAQKLAATAHLPRSPGIYVFRDRGGRPLYVGKATNLRARVRSYFADDRRKVPQLLRETEAVDHYVCADPLEAAVREVRLIQQLEPRFNRAAKGWRRYSYLKLTAERFPRLAVARAARDDGACYLGPFRSARAAQLAREAIETAVPLRRCATRIGRRAAPEPGPPCVPAQLGVATCPCRGQVSDTDYERHVETVRRALTGSRSSSSSRSRRACTGSPARSGTRRRRVSATGSRRSRACCVDNGWSTRCDASSASCSTPRPVRSSCAAAGSCSRAVPARRPRPTARPWVSRRRATRSTS
jgi:DNA polymerase-3 subunit epsilon